VSDSSSEGFVELNVLVPAHIPSSEEVAAAEGNQAKATLLAKLGDARKALSMVHGDGLTKDEQALLGIDSRAAITEQAEKATELIDIMIDAVNGNDFARGKLLFVNYWPKIDSVLGLVQKVFKPF
jgi:hypothetical protein